MVVSELFDPGPPAHLARHFANLPGYAAHRDRFWFDWGPVFYRGRLDGSARVLVIGSDPDVTDHIAMRILVDNIGQRIQGFLSKLGLTRSYVLLNAHPYSYFPHCYDVALSLLDEEPLQSWRNELFALVAGAKLQAIVAFGGQAWRAVDLWSARPVDVPVYRLPHPARPDEATILPVYADAVRDLRRFVTSDEDGETTGPNYGAEFTEADYLPIPRHDLGFGAPPFLGDNAWRRAAKLKPFDGVWRNRSRELIWQARPEQP